MCPSRPKKKLVSCPSGGQNDGESDSWEFLLLFFIYIFILCREMMLGLLGLVGWGTLKIYPSKKYSQSAHYV